MKEVTNDRLDYNADSGRNRRTGPDMADPTFERVVHKHYDTAPYWEHRAAYGGSLTSSYQTQMRH